MGERKGVVREFHFVDMEDPNRYKRLKVLRACDFCRKRKVKCDLPQPNSGTCSNCQRARQPCTFSSIQAGDNAKELSVMTERTALGASKGVLLKQLAIAENDKVDESNTFDIASISKRLLTNYIWDRSSPSHNTNATGELVLPAQTGHTKQLDMTSYKTTFIYLFEIYLRHLKSLFPAAVSADYDAATERISVGLVTSVEKAMLACAAARMYIVERDNTTADYYAVCRNLIHEAKSDMIKEQTMSDSDHFRTCFHLSICYLLVPDIQPDDQYLLHCIERLTQISRSNLNDIIPADDGVRDEEFILTKFWTAYLLCCCKYKNGTVERAGSFNEVEAFKPLSSDEKHVKLRTEHFVFVDLLSQLLNIRLSVMQHLKSQKATSREHYDRLKMALKRWRKALPIAYDTAYNIIDSSFVQRNQKDEYNSLASNYAEAGQYTLLSYLVYTGTTILLEDYLHREECNTVDTLKLKLAKTMISSLETALFEKDISESLFLMTHRLVTEDALHSLFIVFHASTIQLINKGSMDKRFKDAVIRSSRSIKNVIHWMALWYKEENLSQLEVDIHTGSLQKEIETLRKEPKYSKISHNPIPDIPDAVHNPAANGLPAAPSSSVTLPTFSAYEVFLGPESSNNTSLSRYNN
ncbi:hypothetical protein K450DRAFT_226989 [Umbelopsis ramanniana AG]|uniref:Zn(2)-C6 fungal-type domain-containing protein n=1 Tax=Umbelopsis ramanniana AG TaxID=1314678 RepID=A0AAD5EFB9_UMBRA|nr:uncharacterized protein K450DRAFT_226989 [Umbelopsis ramanniana AG]KAI8582397.1 hypothetical protein K450DRAFT_226989 [Umbelopsis ramanniana AG]